MSWEQESLLRGWLVAASYMGDPHLASSLPPNPQPPAMTDPSACKTTIALISGGGRAASGHPGLQAPSSSWASLHQGRGSHGGGGGEVRGQRSPVSHDEVGVFFTSGGRGMRGILQSPRLPLWPSQSLSSFQKPSLPWPLPLQLPKGPGWEAGDSGYGPHLT